MPACLSVRTKASSSGFGLLGGHGIQFGKLRLGRTSSVATCGSGGGGWRQRRRRRRTLGGCGVAAGGASKNHRAKWRRWQKRGVADAARHGGSLQHGVSGCDAARRHRTRHGGGRHKHRAGWRNWRQAGACNDASESSLSGKSYPSSALASWIRETISKTIKHPLLGGGLHVCGQTKLLEHTHYKLPFLGLCCSSSIPGTVTCHASTNNLP